LWEWSILKELFEMMENIASDLRIVWTNKVLVTLHRPLAHRREFSKTVDGRNLPDVVVHTKEFDALRVDIYVPKNSVPLGQIRNIGDDPSVDGENPLYDILKFGFTLTEQLKSKEFQKLLREALAE
jgi:hypothetical protein